MWTVSSSPGSSVSHGGLCVPKYTIDSLTVPRVCSAPAYEVRRHVAHHIAWSSVEMPESDQISPSSSIQALEVDIPYIPSVPSSVAHKRRRSGAFRVPDASNPILAHNDAGPSSTRPSKGNKSDRASRGDDVPTVHASPAHDGASDVKMTPVHVKAAPSFPLAVDSAEIVNMALNLSESRRSSGSRMSLSWPLRPQVVTSPRLVPFAEAPTSPRLRQHLQQQRKSSGRNFSPKPEGKSRRPASGAWTVSPGAFIATSTPDSKRGLPQPEPTSFLFSQATLIRAQKAKDHIELLVQCWRLLELLPAIDSTSPSLTTPNRGRKYNPLQAIRNRKVRARERQSIDGEAQGFSQVALVKEWVDEIANRAEAHAEVSVNSLPPFPGVNAITIAPQPPKPRRQRMDWFVDPEAMLADLYWLGIGDNRFLIEDRHWHKIFRRSSDPVQQSPQALGGATVRDAGGSHPLLRSDSHSTNRDLYPSVLLSNSGADVLHATAKERARQRLHNITKPQYGQSYLSRIHQLGHLQYHDHDLDSMSEGLDSDRDGILRAKNLVRPFAAHDGQDILEKQMNEMLAIEIAKSEAAGVSATLASSAAGALPSQIVVGRLGPVESPRLVAGASPSAAGQRRRRESSADRSDWDDTLSREPSRDYVQTSRASPDTLGSIQRRASLLLDVHSSAPNYSELRPRLGMDPVFPAIGLDSSPPLRRTESPVRKPLTKVRKIFERERPGTELPFNKDDNGEQNSSPIPSSSLLGTPVIPPMGRYSPKPGHRRSSSVMISEQTGRGRAPSNGGRNVGGSVRGTLRHSRIDLALRNGVSKLSDMIWRKEPAVKLPGSPSAGDILWSDATTENLSDGEERGGGRSSDQMLPARIHVYPSSPPESVGTSRARGSGRGPMRASQARSSSPSSEWSSRYEMSKPQRIGPQLPALLATQPLSRSRRRQAPDTSDNEAGTDLTRLSSVRVADQRLNSMLLQLDRRSASAARVGLGRSRDLSVDRSGSPVVSRREASRLRTLVLGPGIMALEMMRRANEPVQLLATDQLGAAAIGARTRPRVGRIPWPEIVSLCKSGDGGILHNRKVARADMHGLAARTLQAAIQSAEQEWQRGADDLADKTGPALQRRIDAARTTCADELTRLALAAGEEADGIGAVITNLEALRLRGVVDDLDKIARRHRRRLRLMRRGLWFTVEWLLVTLMWMVWFVVTIARALLGICCAAVWFVRWLVWL